MTRTKLMSLSGLLLIILALQAVQLVSGQSWRITSNTMAKDIDEPTGRPSQNTTRFLTIDERVVGWFEIETEGFGSLPITWRWIEPEGSIYREHSIFGFIPVSGAYRFWDTMGIRNTPVEAKPGKWTMEVFIKQQKLFYSSFLIEQPPTTYLVQVKIVGFDKRFFTNLYVDGVKVGTVLGEDTKDLSFKIGTAHALSIDEHVEGGNGIRFHCLNNSVSIREGLSHFFLYETEYYMRVVSEYGSSKGEGWYRAGSLASFSVPTQVPGQWGTQYVFRQWTGDHVADSNVGNILMNGPKEVKAVWVADHSQLYVITAIATGSTVALIAIMFMIHKKRLVKRTEERISISSIPNCPECGKQMLYVERIKRYYCSNCKKYRQ